MFLPTQPYKGSRDFYPDDKRIQSWIFAQLKRTAFSFGYQEYDGPMLEAFELYAAKSGEEIVNQQLYSFVDRGERKVAIRPEMTPTLARMVAAKVQELPKPLRWFSIPNVWRYERPQKGRLREHWQLNMDILGGDSALADLEVLTVALSLFESLGGLAHFKIRINHRALVDHVFREKMGLDAEQSLKLTKLIDAKDKMKEGVFETSVREQLACSPAQLEVLESFLGGDLSVLEKLAPCPALGELRELLRRIAARGFGDQVEFSPTIMRGLDYYTGLVFEAYDISPENNRALFGGGRYDNLIGLFGKTQLSGIGFGLGDVTLRNFLETHALLPKFPGWADVFMVVPEAASLETSAGLARQLRQRGLKVIESVQFDGIGKQLQAASKLGARYAVIVGAKEVAAQVFGVKDLGSGEQVELRAADLPDTLYSKCSSPN